MAVDWQRLVLSSTPFADGGGLSDADRTALEARVIADASDVDARVRLVGGYFGRMETESQQRRAEHLAWLAEHRPEIGLGGFGSIIQELAPEGYEATRKAWVAAASRSEVTVEILDNAASFLSSEYPDEAEQLLRRAAETEPMAEEWRSRIASLLIRRAGQADSAEERRRFGRAASTELALALDRTEVDWVLLGIRIDLAEAARLADDWALARAMAERVLVDNESCERTFQYGNAIHSANVVLGWAALAADDLALASEHLVRAGKTPGSPQLNSFGPDMHLARALLVRGERDTVHACLGDCALFWKGREALLETWRAAIARGESTELEPTYD